MLGHTKVEVILIVKRNEWQAWLITECEAGARNAGWIIFAWDKWKWLGITGKAESYLSLLLPLACIHLLGNMAQVISFAPVVLNPNSGLSRIARCKARADNPCWHTALSSTFRLRLIQF